MILRRLGFRHFVSGIILLGLCHCAPGCNNAIEAKQQEIIYYWTVTELKEMMQTKQQEIKYQMVEARQSMASKRKIP